MTTEPVESQRHESSLRKGHIGLGVVLAEDGHDERCLTMLHGSNLSPKVP